MSHRELASYVQRYDLPPAALNDLVDVVDGIVRSALDIATLPTSPGPALGPGDVMDESESTSVDRVILRAPSTVDLGGSVSGSSDSAATHKGDRATELAGYELLDLIGEGGMGRVYRVRDRTLNRVMALKVIRRKTMLQATVVERFLDEAQVTAQLQHPGIVPVHELGQLEDGRLYFTMPEVMGDTLKTAIKDVHAASQDAQWRTGELGWTLRRLVSVFVQVCEAVAYAHSRGVVHRDLKPSNIMVGAHGEVRVLDWGIAKVIGQRTLTGEAALQIPVVTGRTRVEDETQSGSIVGTLSYMAPEQANGKIDLIDARSDVYALGAVLYEVLAGRPPFRGSGVVMLYARSRGPISLDSIGKRTPSAPTGLREICERAIADARDARYAHAGELAQAVRDWLDGVRRRERALELTDDAAVTFAEAQALAHRADTLIREGHGALDPIPSWAPERDKAPGWDRLDEAHGLRRDAAATALRAKMLLRTALTHDPSLVEAHAALATRYQQEHREAEAAQNVEGATRAEISMRAQIGLLPTSHAQRGELVAYLEGEGRLTLLTDPPGAEASLFRYESKNRRLVEVFDQALGRTPLNRVPLSMGSYVIVLRSPNRTTVRYPIHIERQGHWDGRPPGHHEAQPVRLPEAKSLAKDEIYVPAGWFWSGGDPHAPDPLVRRRLWADGFVVQRFAVTNRQYIAFLDALVTRGDEEDALRYVPRERGGSAGAQGSMIYGRDDAGRFELCPDADGDLWDMDWPVVMVTWPGAAAYARWWSEKTGQPWRLPPELAWEKAARGVDGRCFPWGDFLDASWCCMGQSHEGRPLLAVIDSFPVDLSPYGVRGMGGNVRQLCADVFRESGPAISHGWVDLAATVHTGPKTRVQRGGGWGSDTRDCRSANRSFILPSDRQPGIGFRLFRTVDATPSSG